MNTGRHKTTETNTDQHQSTQATTGNENKPFICIPILFYSPRIAKARGTREARDDERGLVCGIQGDQGRCKRNKQNPNVSSRTTAQAKAPRLLNVQAPPPYYTTPSMAMHSRKGELGATWDLCWN